MDLTTLSHRPDQWPAVQALFESGWPRFMWRAEGLPGVDLQAAMRAHPSLQLLLLDEGQLVAMMQAVPADWGDTLPDDGWDRAVREAPLTSIDAPLRVGLAVTVLPERRGQRLSVTMLQHCIARTPHRRLVIPVRPNRKAEYPDLSLAEYLERTRSDGLSIDPWVRTHQRLGASILGICHHSMTLHASPAQWTAWCGAPKNGVHPGLLSAIDSDGVYVEPNVWIEHITPDG